MAGEQRALGRRGPGTSGKPRPGSDEEWRFVAPYLALAHEDAPLREHDLRQVVDAARWMVRAGAGWLLVAAGRLDAGGRRRELPPLPALHPGDSVQKSFQSFMAVLVGFIAVWLLVFITGSLAASVFGAKDGTITRSYLITNLVLFALAAIAGGWLTAWRAPRRPMAHVAALAFALALLVLAAMRSPTEGQPIWFLQSLLAIGPLGALLGGYVASRRIAANARPAA